MNEAKEGDGQVAIKLCNSCGKPPRKTESGTLIPLKQCSRCHQAWYHDSECQKRHYSIHKTTCRPIGDARVASATFTHQRVSERRTEEGTHKVRVQAKKGRGNGLVAAAPFRRGEQISPKGGTSTWEALVPPVLLESQRWSRCALCFSKFTKVPLWYDENPFRCVEDRYVVLFCSPECREKGREYGFDREEVMAIKYHHKSRKFRCPKVSSLAILLVRCQKSSPEILRELQPLQCEPPDGKSPTGESHAHTMTTLATAYAIDPNYEHNTSLDRLMPHLEQRKFVNRLKLNAFTLRDAESLPMGFGIFSLPSFMNHSCRPNVIHTVIYGSDHQLPTLNLTACDDISVGEELMISYLDNSYPRHIRRKHLLDDYYFLCDCPACEDTDRNSLVMGLRCTHCNDPDIPLEVIDTMDPSPGGLSLRCRSCSACDFGMTLEKIKSLERSDDAKDLKLPKQKQRFDDMKRLCFPGSWYLLESASRLVGVCFDKICKTTDMKEKEKYARRALLILNYLSNTSGASEVMERPTSPHQLKRNIEAASRRHASLPDFQVRGDPLAEAFRDWLGPCQDEEDRKKYAAKTDITLEDMMGILPRRHEPLRWSSTSLEYRRTIQLYYIVKLQVFLYPMPPPSTFLFAGKCHDFMSTLYPGQLGKINGIFATMEPTLVSHGDDGYMPSYLKDG